MKHTGNLWDSNPIKVAQIFERNISRYCSYTGRKVGLCQQHASIHLPLSPHLSHLKCRHARLMKNTPYTIYMGVWARARLCTYVFERCFVSVVVFLSFSHVCRDAVYFTDTALAAQNNGNSHFCVRLVRRVCTFAALFSLPPPPVPHSKSCWWIIFIFNYPVVCVSPARARSV